MIVNGIGIVSGCGNGVDDFRNALLRGWKKPLEVDAPFMESGKSFAYLADIGGVEEKALLKKIRRADKLSKMAVCAATAAMRNSGIIIEDNKRVGIITTSAYGAQVTTFGFLDDILEYGEENPSPTAFSNSVHNAAASYISTILGIQGPTLTVTQFFFSLQSALQLARSWLDEGTCDYVLAGSVEQYGDVLGYICNTKLALAPDGKIRPFVFDPSYQVPGEGSVFFLLSNEKTEKSYCTVRDVLFNDEAESRCHADIDIIDADGMLADESLYRQDLKGSIKVAAYSPIYGSMMTGSAFSMAAAALMIHEGMAFASPVKDNPHGLNILTESAPSSIELINCIRYNCFNQKAVLQLAKS